MKVLVIVPSLDFKGPIIVAKNIADNTSEKVKYIFLSLRKNSYANLKRFHEYEILELGMGKVPFFDKKKFRKLISSINPSIIHVHGFWPTILASRYAYEYKLVTTLHNNPVEDFRFEYGSLASKVMVKMLIRSYKNYSAIFAISNYILDVHKCLGVDVNRMQVIYNGIEDYYKSFESKSSHKIRLITVSVLNKVKNVKELIDIISEYIKIYDDNITLDIIGDGTELSYLMTYALEKNVNENVNFLGKLSREQVFEYLVDSDIYVSTSRSEGFGLSVVEAMMLKVPPVVLDIPVMKEILDNKENGMICNSREEFVGAIRQVYSRKDEYGQNARNKYLEYFAVEDMGEKYCEQYFSLYEN